MNFKDKYSGINGKIVNANEKLNIIKDDCDFDPEKNYYITLVLKDRDTIKHCIKISAEWMKNNQLLIPSKINIHTWILDGKINNHTLTIQQTCNTISLVYDNAAWKENRLKAEDVKSQDIIKIIRSYLHGFKELKENKTLEEGLEIIEPSLEVFIDYILTMWEKFDIDTYIEEQQHLIRMYEAEYLQKVSPIQKQMDSLLAIKNSKDKSKKKK